MAIARRESSFMEDAVSTANARGLMQVLPSTADFMLRSKDILPASFRRTMQRRSMRRELLDAKTNVEFGMGYLNFLKQKVGDNPVLIAAAYNAGWQNVLDWLPQTGDMPVDMWVDTIPYKETREYVKAILTYQVIYDWHRKQPTNRFSSLVQMSVSKPQT
jgi:soluble lytic murein transglycosylase